MDKYLIAHDLGTSGDKASLFSIEGKLVKSYTASYKTHYFHNNYAEQETEDWWEAICRSTKEIVKDIEPEAVLGISFSSQMQACVVVDEKGNALYGQLVEIDSLLNDFNRELLEYAKSFEFSEEEFYETENRLNEINRLKAKYGNTVNEILEYAEEKRQRLNELEHYETYIENLRSQTEAAQKEMQSCAEKLSKIRKKAAISFTKEIKAGLEDLNFLDVQLEMRFLQEAKMSALGMDDAEFFISVNPGEPPKPLGTTVSGGELSRILLAIKTVLADKEDTPTLIFDEIDSGISGITAGKVAEKLHIIGQKRQVICITHLPQIAAAADAHYLIQKQTDQTTTKTGIFPLDEDASVGELARLLGGAQVTKNILDSAKEMKEMAKRV